MPKKQDNERMQQQIDENLRRVYAQSVEEEVPERFLKLLEKLKHQGGGTPDPGDGTGK